MTISQAGERRSSRIESLRAVAALSVLIGHIVAFSSAFAGGAAALPTFETLLYGGGYGVIFFFGLTGYLLFWPFAKRYFAEAAPIDLGTYALNRALRILPLYVVVVLVVLIAQGQPLGTWFRFLTFTENFSTATVGHVVGPAWSLVVELHFYILLPLIAWALAKLARGSLGRAAAILVAIGVASLAIRWVQVYEPAAGNPLWRYNLPATFLFFVPGMLLALLRVRWQQGLPDWVRGALRRSDLWIAASVPLWLIIMLGNYDLDFILCPATFLVIGACVLPLDPGRLTRVLEWRPLAFVGVASYSLYLWHVPLLEVLVDAGAPTGLLALALIAIPLSIAVALISYRLIEEPFLRLRGQWARTSAGEPEPAEKRGPRPTTDPAEETG
jgi:peptidoglycan/LPS O-acetylase OafA/YrhL